MSSSSNLKDFDCCVVKRHVIHAEFGGNVALFVSHPFEAAVLVPYIQHPIRLTAFKHVRYYK